MEINIKEIILQVVNFLLLLFLLKAFFWKKFVLFLDERSRRVKEEFDKLRAAQEEALRLKNEYESKLGLIEQEAHRRINEAISDGKKINEQMIKKAHENAQDIIESARKNIKYELSKAKEEIKEEIIDLTIKTAEAVIEDRLTEKEDRKIVENFLSTLDKIE